MKSAASPPPDRPHPRAHEVMALMLRQGDLQPHLHFPLRDARRLASTCRTLRPHHPTQRDEPAAAHLVLMDRMLCRRGQDRGRYLEALRHHHFAPWHGPLPDFLGECRDVIWMAVAWLGTAPRDRAVPEVDPETRRHCLAYLYAVCGHGTWEEGARALDRAREADPMALMALLALDAAEGFVAVAAMGLAVGATVTWGAWLGSAAANAWKAGTAAGKTKAVALGAGAAGGALFGASAAVIFGAVGYERCRRRGVAREQQLATQYGRDAIFCELITGRRYRRDRQAP